MPLKLFIITENSRRVISGTLCPVVPWLEKQRAGKVAGQKEARRDGATREGRVPPGSGQGRRPEQERPELRPEQRTGDQPRRKWRSHTNCWAMFEGRLIKSFTLCPQTPTCSHLDSAEKPGPVWLPPLCRLGTASRQVG